MLNIVKDFVLTVAEDLKQHHNEWSRPGFQALAVYRFGAAVHKLPRAVWRKPLVGAYRIGYTFCRNFYGIELPYSAKVGKGLTIEHQGGIVVHGNTVIGNYCTLRQGVTLGIRRITDPTAAPTLADYVDVGAGAKILGAVHIGAHAHVGANAVVLKNVLPMTTVVGIPARALNTF